MHPLTLFTLVFLTHAAVAIAEPAAPTSAEEALAKVEAMEDSLDFAAQVELLSPFADSGSADLLYALAYASMYAAIDGKKPEDVDSGEMKRVMSLARRALDGGEARAYNLLYLMHANGWGVEVDDDMAAAYLRQGAEAGDEGAKLNLAISLFTGNSLVDRDRDAACALFRELGEDSSVQAYSAYYLGLATFRGECGYEADRDGGMKLIEIAAKHDIPDALRDVAKNLEFGWTQPADLQAALDNYRKAADLGDAHSEWRMGMSHVNGEVDEPDASRAVAYFREAADREYAPGLISLAVMYATGDGVDQDYEQARQLYERAAAQGESHALRSLAGMYRYGQGVDIDLVRSRLLYLQSLALGGDSVSSIETDYAEQMSAEQIAESDRQFQSWRGQ